ncbi:MAG: M28 family peptidase [Fidelibacterota bacterium]
MINSNRFILLCLTFLFFSSCSDQPIIDQLVNMSTIEFSGDKALNSLTTFVTKFPDRDSGQPNNEKAALWLKDKLNRLGLTTRIDRWSIINYNREVLLKNVVGILPGKSSKELVIVAHFDQSPDTHEGADNDGSGISILMQLAEIFANGPTPEYTLVFLASDGEEYGMLGTLQFVETHHNISNIIAGISLDNVGKKFYDGLLMDPRGQFRGYGALWFQVLAREAALSIHDDWAPNINPVINQLLDQAVPVSFMDEGPMVAAGIPSFGFTGAIPPEWAEKAWETYHSPEDLVIYQSVSTLEHTGRITEAIIRQCLAMKSFPNESGPYLYFHQSQTVLKGFPLWLIFLSIPTLFFIISYHLGKKTNHRLWAHWKGTCIHYLSLWIPLILSVLITYVFVAVGLMDKYHLYPATSKDAAIYSPKWIAVILWIASLGFLFWIGRKMAGVFYKQHQQPTLDFLKQFGFTVVGLCSLILLWINPFSLIFIFPTIAWIFFSGRRHGRKIIDSLIFLSGCFLIFVLIYFFGFEIMKNGFAILWYLMMMFSIRMISFPMAVLIMAFIASGLAMVVNPTSRN